MRKKELVQTHALLEATQYLIENENMPAEMISTYYALDVRPSSIHKSKTEPRSDHSSRQLNRTVDRTDTH